MKIKRLSLFIVLLALVACLFASCALLGGSGSTDSGDTQTNTNTNTNSGKPSTNTNTSTSECEHVFDGEWVLRYEPKCVTRGEERNVCSICGESVVRYLAPLGHTEEIVPGYPATCGQKGLTDGKKCSVCNAIIATQKQINATGEHNYNEFVSLTTEPTFSQGGMAKFKCTGCGEDTTLDLPKLVSQKITEADIYNVDTNNIYNPAYDSRWNMFDGDKNSAGVYAQGADWFGDIGDKLIVTLSQEIILKELYVYVAGNWTEAVVTVKNASGSALIRKTVRANSAAYGGTGEKVEIFKGEKNNVYIIEVEITSLKESYQTFKLTEIEAYGAKKDARILSAVKSHIHDHRDLYEQLTPSTCEARGTATYQCYCGDTADYYTPKIKCEYDNRVAYVAPTCKEDGSATYECTCGLNRKTVTLPKTGHNYQRLVEYISSPTTSEAGMAKYKCITCNLIEERTVPALKLEEIRYLRVVEVNGTEVKLRFNIYDDPVAYDIRYSANKITEANFDSATQIDAIITGNKELTATINLDAGLDKCYYVAVRPYSGTNEGLVTSVRVGGNLQIPINYSDATVYHGEIIASFAKMFDEQKINGLQGTPETVLSRFITNTSDQFYGMRLSPIIDLETIHYVSSFYLYYAETGKVATVRWSDTPVDFQAADSEWDGVYTISSSSVGWNEIQINSNTRYIQVVFTDGSAPHEVQLYGYQNGDGDDIYDYKISLPSINEMMGMCGFAAIGGGNTPVESVECTSVLREYHNFGWSYSMTKFPNKASVFASSSMGNFDERYEEFVRAGITVIPCIQWKLADEPMSNKVDATGMPMFDENGSLIKGDYWDKFNPLTYFVYADNMFAYAARYGVNTSMSLLQIAGEHTNETLRPAVGLGLVKWLELGNEPDANWHGGMVNYYAPYQLAALNSACYDGHEGTLKSAVSDYGYHYGIKNADPSMGVAMAGISAASNEYITAMCYWMKANRTDGNVAIDAFNVHHYMSKPITVQTPNGEATRYVGMCPEEADLQGVLSQLIGIRNKYYGDKEVWITEFGWDTNQSYATVNSAHAYGDYTGREVQAMWLTRAYLLLSASGVDKATMYMCEDTGLEDKSVGKFFTSGVIAFEKDENGNTVEVKKESFYYLYTLKNTLGGYTFIEEVEAYDENVMIYKFQNENGKTAYAVWCPTSDGTVVEGYCFGTGSTTAELVENEHGYTNGVKSTLTPDQYGYVTINVTENPIYILVD